MLYPTQGGAHGPVVAGPAQVHHLGHRVVNVVAYDTVCTRRSLLLFMASNCTPYPKNSRSPPPT
jgi:hypothetical protein